MKENVEIIEIWSPTKNGDGMAIKYPSGEKMKVVVRLANGVPIFMEKDWILEKRILTEEEYDNYSKGQSKLSVY